MQSIDFLPTRYREQAIRRQSRVWSLTVSMLFGSLVFVAAAAQFGIRFSVRSQVTQLESSYQGAIDTKKKFDAITTELQQRQHSAKLFAYLSHPWPRTQILKHVVAPLPESILLREMRFAMESPHSNGPPPTMPNNSNGDSSKELSAERDLKTLRKQRDALREWLYVTGIAQDVAELHQYVDAISRSSLVEKAELRSLETSTDKTEGKGIRSSAATFVLTVQIKPGYGQPGGPRPKSVEPAVVNDSKPVVESSIEFQSADSDTDGEPVSTDGAIPETPYEPSPESPRETQSASANSDAPVRS